jgi:sporulation protein YlmC with PRC-barrel domain
MKRLFLIPLLVLALLLAACADSGTETTPGAIGTEPLGTEPGGLATEQEPLATEPMATEPLATEPVATEAVTTPDTAGTAVATEGTEDLLQGMIALPFSMFDVATMAETGVGTGTGTGTGQATPDAGAGTPAAGGTQAAGTPGAVATGVGTAAVSTPLAQATGETGMDTEDTGMVVRASDLLGSEIVDRTGNNVATVDDVLVDETGNIAYIVFDATNLADMEETGAGTGTGTGQATPSAGGTDTGTAEPAATAGVETTPMAGATGAVADEDTILVLNADVDEARTSAVAVDSALLDQPGFMIDASGNADAAELNGMLRVSRFTDFNLVNTQNEDLGEVEDILVDLQQGMLQYGVVDFGGFLGIGETTVVVPWDMFTVNQATTDTDASLVLDVSEETLRNAPTVNVGEWPNWPESLPTDWETETRTFWETAS